MYRSLLFLSGPFILYTKQYPQCVVVGGSYCRHWMGRQFSFPCLRNKHRSTTILLANRNCHTKQGTRILFLGTPHCAAVSLQRWLQWSQQNPLVQIAAVITQPANARHPSRNAKCSPVYEIATQHQIPVWTPENLKDTSFLSQVTQLAPDIAITAAYGKWLPDAFLKIPKHGVVNIHPSLLPKFRGAAPVQRALLQGVTETGVSILFTVSKMDAGPIIAQEKVVLHGDEMAGPLLTDLFLRGTDLIMSHLESILQGTVKTWDQKEEEATYAPKLKKEEGWLSFHENAVVVHNKVRALSDSIGTFANFHIRQGDQVTVLSRLKIHKTRLVRRDSVFALGIHQVVLNPEKDGLRVTCDDGSQLDILEIQPSGKRVMNAREFYNGLQKKNIEREKVDWIHQSTRDKDLSPFNTTL
ncbi:hypothetical protein GAYE_PCTG52G1258 [Galdieria yellowstonensis]|uniref:Methionyl-tRNA formyltransferase, mitochondrial n=1 Tax=Galdieria yellowstonensis TaxID=3028027 RepID=A0AAV9I749_9RHOD|nr:hypothetical protein GAYE_PCTG52G1258 [Galdieria yellowstonensis]